MESDNAYHSKGIEAFNSSQFQAAVNFFTKALLINPSDALLLNNRAVCYRQLANYESALTDITTAIKLEPGNALYYSTKATILTKLHRQLEAIVELDRAIKIEPLLEYFTNKIVILKKLKMYREALENIEKIELRGMGSDEVMFYKGTILYEMGEFKKANDILIRVESPQLQSIAKPFLEAINRRMNF